MLDLVRQAGPSSVTLAPDADGVVLPINADTAGRGGRQPGRRLMLTDIDGLYTRWPDRDSLVSGSTPAHWRSYLPTRNRAWSRRACGRSSAGCPARYHRWAGHTLRVGLFTDAGTGTKVVRGWPGASTTTATMRQRWQA